MPDENRNRNENRNENRESKSKSKSKSFPERESKSKSTLAPDDSFYRGHVSPNDAWAMAGDAGRGRMMGIPYGEPMAVSAATMGRDDWRA